MAPMGMGGRIIRVALAALATSAVACGDGDGAGTAQPTGSPVETAAAELPFGLVQIEGTAPVGRPVVYDDEPDVEEGEAVAVTSLQAAYRVTDGDPVAVFRAWVDQLDVLALDEMSVYAGVGPGEPWIQASGSGRDYADLQLWVTGGEPILLVDLNSEGDAAPGGDVAVDDTAGDPPAPSSVVDDAERSAGDELFAEQGDVMHLPQDTRALMPTLPTFGGTGGSTSVLTAEDGEAAVRALLDEARGHDADGEVSGPDVDDVDGTRIVRGGFVITAGGWGFDVVAVEAPGDGGATVYVVSYAD
jgi:hypothetical protein